MRYKRFEDLPVWRDAIEFSVQVFEFTTMARRNFHGLGDLKNQIERASVSVSNNIAEGFERGTTRELIQYIYIAKGSAGECRSMTYILGSLKDFLKFKDNIVSLRKRAESIGKQLNAWADYLKRSDIKGTKFLTEKERGLYKNRKELEAFDAEMARFRKEFDKKLKQQELENYEKRSRE